MATTPNSMGNFKPHRGAAALLTCAILLSPAIGLGGVSLSVCADPAASASDKATHCARSLEKEELTDSQRWGVHINLARALSDLGRHDRAEATFTIAQEMNPHKLAVYPGRATAREAQGDIAGARADWDLALMLAADDVDIRIRRGGFFMRRGAAEQALIEYEAALAADPGGMDILFNRALALIALNRRDSAILDLTIVIAATPGDAEAHYHRGRAQAGQDDEGALADFTQATVLAPEWSWPWFKAGKILDTLDRQAEALTHYRRAFELGHNDPWLLSRIRQPVD